MADEGLPSYEKLKELLVHQTMTHKEQIEMLKKEHEEQIEQLKAEYEKCMAKTDEEVKLDMRDKENEVSALKEKLAAATAQNAELTEKLADEKSYGDSFTTFYEKRKKRDREALEEANKMVRVLAEKCSEANIPLPPELFAESDSDSDDDDHLDSSDTDDDASTGGAAGGAGGSPENDSNDDDTKELVAGLRDQLAEFIENGSINYGTYLPQGRGSDLTVEDCKAHEELMKNSSYMDLVKQLSDALSGVKTDYGAVLIGIPPED